MFIVAQSKQVILQRRFLIREHIGINTTKLTNLKIQVKYFLIPR